MRPTGLCVDGPNVRFAERYFVSEASIYRLLKAYDLITSPAFITMTAGSQQALPLLKVERLRRGMAAEQPQIN